MIMGSRMLGNAMKTSHVRMSNSSVQRPRYAATVPTTQPKITDALTTATAVRSEIRVPKMHAAEDVAAEVVGAEQVLCRGCEEALREVLPVGVVRGDERGRDRADCQGEENREADHRAGQAQELSCRATCHWQTCPAYGLRSEGVVSRGRDAHSLILGSSLA